MTRIPSAAVSTTGRNDAKVQVTKVRTGLTGTGWQRRYRYSA
ncbi:MAG: hypothetical protein PHP39_08615 [Oscillospiraceae bacterium]|nr:hypothetical protein [Oscillospiraceae bacterium]